MQRLDIIGVLQQDFLVDLVSRLNLTMPLSKTSHAELAFHGR